MALRFAEEILLLALDDETGKLHPLPERALDFAIVGALLMELAFRNQIDNDDKQLVILDRKLSGDPLLDKIMSSLPSDVDTLPTQNALTLLAEHAPWLRDELFASLTTKGILREEARRFLWVLPNRRYPVCDDSQEEEVKSRIRNVVLNGTIPDPQDVVIICLMKACDLSPYVFSAEELKQAKPRIEAVAKMDLIGQAMTKAIQRIQDAILESIAYMGM